MISRLSSLILALFIVYIVRSALAPGTHGPDSNIVKDQVYRNREGKCYSMSPIAYVCPFGA